MKNTHCKRPVEVMIDFADALSVVENGIMHDNHPTLFEKSVPSRLRAAADLLEQRIAKKRSEPPTCFECGSPVTVCECN